MILIEETTTNLLTAPNDFTNAAWIKTNATVTANAALAPDGTNTAAKITPSAAGGLISQSYSVDPSGKSYTAGIWIRADVEHTAKIRIENNDATEYQEQTINVKTYWQRVYVSKTFSLSKTAVVVKVIADDTSTNYVYVWGPQLEQKPYPTTYINGTRAAETLSRNITLPAEFTIAGNFTTMQGSDYAGLTAGTTTQTLYKFQNGSNYFGIVIKRDNTNPFGLYLQVNIGGTLQESTITGVSLSAFQIVQHGLYYKNGSFGGFIQLNNGSILSFTPITATLTSLTNWTFYPGGNSPLTNLVGVTKIFPYAVIDSTTIQGIFSGLKPELNNAAIFKILPNNYYQLIAENSQKVTFYDITGMYTVDTPIVTNKVLAPASAYYAGISEPYTFTRSSVAYKSDGTQVAANVPRIENGAVMIEEETTNLLTANQQSIETDISGFTAYGGAAISRDTTEKWIGNASLKVVTGSGDGLAGGVRTNAISASANSKYTGSVYIKGTGTVKVYLKDATNNITSDATTVTLTSSWQRVTTTITTGASAVTDLGLYIEESTVDSNITFFIDGLQIEAKAYATSFVDGTRAAETLTIPTSVINPQEFTIEIFGGKIGGVDVVYKSVPLISNWNTWSPNNQKGFLIRFLGSVYLWKPRFTICDGVNYYDCNSTISVNKDEMFYIAAVYKAGQIFKIFVNGQLSASSTPPAQCVLENTTYLGYTKINSGYLNGFIDTLRISNRARTDAEIASAYQNGLTKDNDTTFFHNFNSLTTLSSFKFA